MFVLMKREFFEILREPSGDLVDMERKVKFSKTDFLENLLDEQVWGTFHQ